jgi:hypothetical protein
VLVRRGVLSYPGLRRPAATLPDIALELLETHLAALDLPDVRGS